MSSTLPVCAASVSGPPPVATLSTGVMVLPFDLILAALLPAPPQGGSPAANAKPQKLEKAKKEDEGGTPFTVGMPAQVLDPLPALLLKLAGTTDVPIAAADTPLKEVSAAPKDAAVPVETDAQSASAPARSERAQMAGQGDVAFQLQLRNETIDRLPISPAPSKDDARRLTPPQATAEIAEEKATPAEPARTPSGPMPAAALLTAYADQFPNRNEAAEAPVQPGPTAAARLEAPDQASKASPAQAREIHLRVQDAGTKSAELRVTERAGELHVTVRSNDTGLTQTLRGNLPDLMNRLEQTGWQTKVSSPDGSASVTRSPAAKDAEPGHLGSGQEHTEWDRGGQQQRRQQQPSRPQHWGSDEEGSLWT